MQLSHKGISRLGRPPSRSGVLIASSPFGGGHARRSLAMGLALSRLRPDLPIQYLSGGPDVEIYRRAGVSIHDLLLFETYPVADGRLNRQRLRSLFVRSEVQHAVKVAALIARYRPEMVMLDEMLLPLFAAKRLGCRVGFVTHAPTFPRPTMAADPDLALATVAVNRLRLRAILDADIAFYVGSREHLPESRLWPWVERHMQVVGLMSNVSRPSLSRAEALQRLGFSPDKPLVVVTVGALAMGRYLLEAALNAWPLADMPDAQLLVVCGASIDPRDLPAPVSDRVRVMGLVDDLPAYLAAADMAIVQAGLTTVGECLALGTPMVCVPIKWHREQENNARYAERVGGARILEQVTPARLAEEVTSILRQHQARRQQATGHEAPPSPIDGATKAAMHIERFLARAG